MLQRKKTTTKFPRIYVIPLILGILLNPIIPVINLAKASTTTTVNVGVEKDSFWARSSVTAITDRHAISIGNTWWGS